MQHESLLNGLSELRSKLSDLIDQPENETFIAAKVKNPWFTQENMVLATEGLLSMLDEAKVTQWLEGYDITRREKKIGVICAGNIPAVGFHDILSVLASGNNPVIKLSSQDDVFLNSILKVWKDASGDLDERISRVDKLELAQLEAVIATGSNNTSRYFEQYFAQLPNIIRKNRTSVAVLSGKESTNELNELGKDVFSYFGLGCRNVSKIYVPEEFDFQNLLKIFEGYDSVANHNKYVNNYDYNKSIYLVNRWDHFDTGFYLLTENENLAAPVSMGYYSTYKEIGEVESAIKSKEEEIQCVVSNELKDSINFGQTQSPELWDYADNVDTMKFLVELP